MKPFIITIDGPASSGKGTIAKILAHKLGFNYLDSGAIYRVVGLIAIRNQTSGDEIDKLENLLKNLDLKFEENKVILNGEDVTDQIRDEKIGMQASNLAKISKLRSSLLEFQRKFARSPGLVTDGRDMGSVVFPDADLKIFLTASAMARALRRFDQLKANNKTSGIDLNEIYVDILRRDKQDSERKVAPLKYDKSYKFLDNSDLSIDSTIKRIISWLN